MLREKIFTDRNDIDDFLLSSPCATLNKSIYDAFLTLREPDLSNNRQRLRCPALVIFNEAYYQCTKLQIDKHPEEDFTTNYFEDARENLDCHAAAETVFSIVFVLLSLMSNKTVKTENFRQIILKHLSSSAYFTVFASIIDDFRGIPFPLSFQPMPIDVSDPIKIDWARITHNFDAQEVAEAIQLADSEEEQHAILDAIEMQLRLAHPCNGNGPYEAVITSLRTSIVARFSAASPDFKKENWEGINQVLVNQKNAVDKDFAELSKKYRELLNENQALKKEQFIYDELLKIAREYHTNNIYQILRIFASKYANPTERIKIEEELAADPNSDAVLFTSPIFLNKAKGYKTNFQRVINCFCELEFFHDEFGKPIPKVEVFNTFGIVTHSELKEGTKRLSNRRNEAKADCRSELAIFDAMTLKQKEICELLP